MTILTVFCDKCGETILENRTVFDIRAGAMRARRETIDLCDDCCRALDEWLRAGKGAPAGVAGASSRDAQPALMIP